MCAAIFVVSAGYGVAVFDAILKYPYIRLSAFAYAGGDEIGIGDISDACRLGIFIPSLLCDSKHYFFILVYTSEFLLPVSAKAEKHRTVISNPVPMRFANVNERRKSVRERGVL